MKYLATIYETTSMVVEIEADDAQEAEDKVWEMIDNELIDMTDLYHDSWDVEINRIVTYDGEIQINRSVE